MLKMMLLGSCGDVLEQSPGFTQEGNTVRGFKKLGNPGCKCNTAQLEQLHLAQPDTATIILSHPAH